MASKHEAIKNRFTGEVIIPEGKYGKSLRGADLRCANLRCADLRCANLRGADLRCADLRGADLFRADLRWADLRGADLFRADLQEANIDYSCWPLWCGSLGVTVDIEIIRQHAYHFCRLKNPSPRYKAAVAALAELANEFHQVKNGTCPKIGGDDGE